MPSYIWECEGCGTTVEVFRRISDYNVGPLQDCKSCSIKTFRISPENYKGQVTALANREEHKSHFPLTVPGLVEKIAVDSNNRLLLSPDGRPKKVYEDVTFKNKAEHKEWCKNNGYVTMMDGRSPMVTSSQKSLYDSANGCDDPAPSARAKEMAAETRFVEPRELYEKYGMDRATVEANLTADQIS